MISYKEITTVRSPPIVISQIKSTLIARVFQIHY